MIESSNVFVITGGRLPVPAVKGGAIQTLVDSLLKENESEKRIDFSIFSIFDEEAYIASTAFSAASFNYVKVPWLINKADRAIDRTLMILKGESSVYSKDYFRKVFLLSRLKKTLLENDYDYLVFENASYLLRVLSSKEICDKYKNKMICHLHSVIPSGVFADGLRQCFYFPVSEYLNLGIKDIGCDASRSFVVKNGIQIHDTPDVDVEASKLKQRLGIDESAIVITYVGRVVEQKGIEKLVDAFSLIDDGRFKLLIVGGSNFADSTERPFEIRLNKKIEALGNRVLRTGYVDHSDVDLYYRISDIAVFPSLEIEAAGLTILEALSNGVPVITTDVGGIPEYFDKRFGLMLHVDEKLPNSIAAGISRIAGDLKSWKDAASEAPGYIKEHYSERSYYESFCKGIRFVEDFKKQ